MTTPTTVNVRIQLRADTAANWTAANPILLANEVGLETDTKKLKVGNGSTAWNSLAYFPSIVSGGTVLGNLEIGSTGTLTFEGSTADNFETTLGVINPTADRTITLPNQSGTVVVSGNASIVNADIAANAEIAVSKLANGTANQVIVTDGTNVSWSDDLTLAGNLTVNGTTTTINTQDLLVEDKNIIIGNVDTPTDVTADGGGITLKGTTDKTINWVDATDAWTSSERFSVPLGSAASPSLTFTGDENTGLYSPGADQLALSTSGTGRLFVDASGRVGIGTGTPDQDFVLENAGNTGTADDNAGAAIRSINRSALLRLTANPSFSSSFELGDTDATGAGAITYNNSNNNLFFTVNSQERLRITSAGLVGIGTSSPASSLHVNQDVASGNYQSRITLENSDQRTVIGSYWQAGVGQYSIIQSTNEAESVSSALLLNPSGGNVGIGTTSPATKLHVFESASPAAACEVRAGNITSRCSLLVRADGDGEIQAPNGNLIFNTNAGERARIDSSGRLLVGTSSAYSITNTHPATLTPHLQASGADENRCTALLTYWANGASGSRTPSLALAKSDGDVGVYTAVASGDKLGEVSFHGADGSAFKMAAAIQGFVDGTPGADDMPGRLVFSTTADGASSPTERMRIDSEGQVGIGITPASTRLHVKSAGTSSSSSAIIALDAANVELFKVRSDGAFFTGNSSVSPYNLTTATAANCVIHTDSTLRRSTSSIKYKTSVEDLEANYADTVVFGARPVWYRSLCEGDNAEWSYYGLIAEEVAELDPRLVFWGNPDEQTGVVQPEGVQYDRLTVMLIDVVQRQQKTIESLEARLTAAGL